jgi:hypothetical protein
VDCLIPWVRSQHPDYSWRDGLLEPLWSKPADVHTSQSHRYFKQPEGTPVATSSLNKVGHQSSTLWGQVVCAGLPLYVLLPAMVSSVHLGISFTQGAWWETERPATVTCIVLPFPPSSFPTFLPFSSSPAMVWMWSEWVPPISPDALYFSCKPGPQCEQIERWQNF